MTDKLRTSDGTQPAWIMTVGKCQSTLVEKLNLMAQWLQFLGDTIIYTSISLVHTIRHKWGKRLENFYFLETNFIYSELNYMLICQKQYPCISLKPLYKENMSCMVDISPLLQFCAV